MSQKLNELVDKWAKQSKDGHLKVFSLYGQTAYESASYEQGMADARRFASDELAAALLLSEAAPPAKIGWLTVDIRYSVGAEAHVSGPMNYYPEGVASILRAVDAALSESERIQQSIREHAASSPGSGEPIPRDER